MKKNYNQPVVETAKVQATSLMNVVSPTGLPVETPIPGAGGD
jgi:hypothetical protein